MIVIHQGNAPSKEEIIFQTAKWVSENRSALQFKAASLPLPGLYEYAVSQVVDMLPTGFDDLPEKPLYNMLAALYGEMIAGEYFPISTAPSGLLHVCWGDEASSLEFGVASHSNGKWWDYTSANPHARGHECATPTGWSRACDRAFHKAHNVAYPIPLICQITAMKSREPNKNMDLVMDGAMSFKDVATTTEHPPCKHHAEPGASPYHDASEGFTDLCVELGGFRITWEYIGEGLSGDFDPENPADYPHLRFSCHKRGESSGEWEEVSDGSYCTRLPTSTSLEYLLRAALLIFGALDQPSPKRRLEELSWLCMEDLETTADVVEALRQKYPEGEEHPRYGRVDWRAEVAMDNTLLGYYEWLLHKEEEESHEHSK